MKIIIGKNKFLYVLLVFEILILMILGIFAVHSKLNSQIVSPSFDYWSSRYIGYSDGFCIAEGVIDQEEFANGTIDLIYGPYMNLSKGGYTYSIEYECSQDQGCFVHAFEAEGAIKDSVKKLNSKKNYYKGHFVLKKQVDNLEIRVTYNGVGDFRISNITVVSSPYNYYCEMIRLLAIFIVIDTIIIFRCRIVDGIKLCVSCVCKRVSYENDKKERIEGLDFLKLFAAFLVINVHMPLQGVGGELWLGLCRCATPIFFVISGFFYTYIQNNSKETIQIRKVIKLIILSSLLYYVARIIMWKMYKIEYDFDLFSLDNLKWFLLYNRSPFEFHLWYLSAFLYVLVIFNIMWKYKAESMLIGISPLLLAFGLSIGNYARIVWHREIYHTFSRGFLLEGIPFFAMGLFLYRLNCVKKPRNLFLALGILFGSALTIAEVFALKRNGVEADGDIYIGTIFMAAFMVLFFANNSLDGVVFKRLSLMGKKYSLSIYIIHILIIYIWNNITKTIGSKILCYIGPIIVFTCSLVLAIIYDKLKKGFSTFIKHIII